MSEHPPSSAPNVAQISNLPSPPSPASAGEGRGEGSTPSLPSPRTRPRLPVATVQRIERLVGGDPVTEDQVLRFIGSRYGAENLFYVPAQVAEQILKRPQDFVRAAKRFTQPEFL